MCPKRNRRGGSVALRGRCCAVGGECIAQSAGVHRRCGGEQKCSGRACRCAGASEGLRRGVSCEGCGECIAQPAGMRRGCVGERKCSGRACRCAGASKVFGGEWVVRSAGNVSRSLRACVGAEGAIGSAREGRVAVRGRAKVFGGEWVVRSAGVHRAACGRASALRGGAEVLGAGVSLCGGERRSSAGNGW